MVCDSSGACDTASVMILVSPVNDPPVAISSDTVVTSGWIVPIGLNGSDPDGDRISYEIIDGPSNGHIVQFDPLTGRLTYVSSAGYVGPDAVVFQVCDSHGACDQGLLQLFVVDGGGGGGAEGEAPRQIVISEIAWAGTRADPRHEWIELRNVGAEEVDLTGWVLRWRSKLPAYQGAVRWKAIALSGVVQAAAEVDHELQLTPVYQSEDVWRIDREAGNGAPGFYLLERENDDVVSDIDADLVYDDRLPLGRALDLADEGEIVELMDPFGTVVDTANADNPQRGGWAAGSAATLGTMERTDLLAKDLDSNWHTNLGVVTRGLDALGDRVWGTPRAENSPIIENLVADLSFDARKAQIGEPLSVRLPVSEDNCAGGISVMLTRPGSEAATVLDSGSVTRQPDNVGIRIATDGFPSGEAYLWILCGDGSVYFVPVQLEY